ncbi:tyrosine recombinase [Anaerotruncus sp. 80]|uniref:Tyrosine recombinase XerC n=1 Tax=Anaerotruncus colihominis TaxID=169435 RepID=A0A845QQK4_9FIRM|nr:MULTISPECIES: tyrosine recombinase [Anaerotruncus]NBH62973.1 tyrosine recombinase [Anaerotruncus colihominis]NCF03627.1 tyrosine recombinase [Anaerotruncus sp. 80]
MELYGFITYLKEEKKSSDNTCEAYMRDIKAFGEFLQRRGIVALEKAGSNDVAAYMMELKNSGKSKATINRKLSSIRTYYKFLIKKGMMKENPTEDIKSPRIERRELDYLTIEEVETLLLAPDESIKGIRDRAILEVLYATGIRVSEIIELRLKDINLRMGFLTLNGAHGRARIVPMGSMARRALDHYILSSRPALMKDGTPDDPESILFVNYLGEAFSRQGFWKLMKQYGRQVGLEDRLTPHILRTSFAVHMVQNGADLKSLQELMGHEDIMATRIYLSVTKNRIKDVYDKTHPRA